MKMNAKFRRSRKAKSMWSAILLGAANAGVATFEFDGTALKQRWMNPDVCPMTVIPMQSPGRVWIVGTRRQDRWKKMYLLGLDSKSGDVAVAVKLAGRFQLKSRNPAYAGIGTDGTSLVFGTLEGVVRVGPQKEVIVWVQNAIDTGPSY